LPELPEVQTIVNGLNSIIIEKKISRIAEYRRGTVENSLLNVDYGKVKLVERRGKYIIVKTTAECKIVIHLRMTGKLIFEADSDRRPKHCRAEIFFSDGSRLIFDDVRTFGKIQVMKKSQAVPALEKLGAEPLSDQLNPEFLSKQLKNRKALIRNLLLNQNIIAGLGNIYVLEILYRCKIDPRKQADGLSLIQIEKIVEQTKIVLKEAIEKNGTTISDYRSVEDQSGQFQNFLRVYQKKKCKCGTEIKRIKMAGRSAYFCPSCQQ